MAGTLYGRPRGEELYAKANRNFSWSLCLSELIDNALDAKASVVTISFAGDGKRKSLTIADNGAGCSDMSQFYEGGATSGAPDRVGHYGVGAKDAALVIGQLDSQMSVRSVKDGMAHSVCVDWRFMASNQYLLAEDPVSEAAGPDECSGTTIKIFPVTKAPPSGARWRELCDELAFRYSPAISAGAVITLCGSGLSVKPVTLSEWVPPKFEPKHHIDTLITVDGKTAQVVCGVVAKGKENLRRGLSYQYLYRVVEASTHKGCGTHNVSRIAGFVRLGSGWRLTTNKDGIQSPEGLYAKVEQVCKAVLEAGDRAVSELSSSALSGAVETLINGPASGRVDGESDDAKAKRAGPEDAGLPAGLKGKGSPHRKAERTQDGERIPSQKRPKKARAAYHLAWDDFARADVTGSVTGTTITLNNKNPAVALAKAENNALAIAMTALALVAFDESGKTPRERQPQFQLFECENAKDTFQRMLGALTMSMAIDGKPITSSKAHLRAVGL